MRIESSKAPESIWIEDRFRETAASRTAVFAPSLNHVVGIAIDRENCT
jgi:hypothetical protein